MCDKDLLVGYLYDDLDPAQRQLVDAHLASCAACREEVAGLRSTRAQLGLWAPPEPELAFRIVRGAASPTAPAARRFHVPRAWGLAAAAVLVLAAASAIANVELQYGQDGLTVRTGWRRPEAVPQPAPTPVAASERWKTDLQALEQRLRGLESSLAERDKIAPARAAASRSTDADLLRQVRRILDESERRQQRELVLRIGQVVRDFEATRRTDFARLQQGIAQVEGKTDTTLIRQRQIEDHLARVGYQR